MGETPLNVPKPTPCWVNQTALGHEFGIGSKTVGKWLQDVGLRTSERTPSDKALAGGFVKLTANEQGICFFLWDKEMTVAALVRAGHRAKNAPPPKMIGPFHSAPRPDGQFDVLGKDGVVATVDGQENTEHVCYLLNLAWKHRKSA